MGFLRKVKNVCLTFILKMCLLCSKNKEFQNFVLKKRSRKSWVVRELVKLQRDWDFNAWVDDKGIKLNNFKIKNEIDEKKGGVKNEY